MLLKDRESVLEIINHRLDKKLGVGLRVASKDLPTGMVPVILFLQEEEGHMIEKGHVLALDKCEILSDLSVVKALLIKEGFEILQD